MNISVPKQLQLMYCLHFTCYSSMSSFSICSLLSLRMYIVRLYALHISVTIYMLSDLKYLELGIYRNCANSFFLLEWCSLHFFLFSTTINKVETNAEYFYHYHRYTLIQEYFEKPIMPIPPLILVWYLSIIARCVWYLLKGCCKKQDRFGNNKYHVTGIFSECRLTMRLYDKTLIDIFQRWFQSILNLQSDAQLLNMLQRMIMPDLLLKTRKENGRHKWQ